MLDELCNDEDNVLRVGHLVEQIERLALQSLVAVVKALNDNHLMFCEIREMINLSHSTRAKQKRITYQLRILGSRKRFQRGQ